MQRNIEKLNEEIHVLEATCEQKLLENEDQFLQLQHQQLKNQQKLKDYELNIESLSNKESHYKQQLKESKKCFEETVAREKQARDEVELITTKNLLESEVSAKEFNERAEQLQHELLQCQTRLQSMKVREDQFKDELLEIQDRNQNYRLETDQLRLELSQYRMDLEQRTTELQACKQQLMDADRRIQNTIVNEEQRHKQESEMLEQAKMERDCMRHELGEQLRQVASLQTRLDEYKRVEPRQDVAELQASLKAVQAELENARNVTTRHLAQVNH